MKFKKIVIPGETRFLGKVRKSVRVFLGKNRFDDEEIWDVEMSIDEVLANIIKHSYENDPDIPEQSKVIKIEFRIIPDGVEIIILDKGKPFDPNKIPEVDLKEHIDTGKNHGLGIYAIRKFMDKLEHSYIEGDGNKTILRKMRKNLK